MRISDLVACAHVHPNDCVQFFKETKKMSPNIYPNIRRFWQIFTIHFEKIPGGDSKFKIWILFPFQNPSTRIRIQSTPEILQKKYWSEVQFIKIKFVFLMLSMSNVYQDEQCWDYTKLAWICHHWYTRKPWIIKSAPFIDTRISFWAALSSFITPRIERCL